MLVIARTERLGVDDGTPQLGVSTARRRLSGIVLSAIPLGAGFFAVLFSDDRQGWHDRRSGTQVVFTERGYSAAKAVAAAAPAPSSDSSARLRSSPPA